MFPQIDVVLSGYQGGEGIGDVIIDAVARVKAANPRRVYACDPVMGNAKSGCFVAPAIPVLLRERVVPVADIITPNQFELGLPHRHRARHDSTPPSPRSTSPARWDRARCSSRASSAPTAKPARSRCSSVDDSGAWIVQTPLLPMKANGSGDVTAALFTAHYRETGDAADALARTASSVFDLLEQHATRRASASCSSSSRRRPTPTRACSSRPARFADRAGLARPRGRRRRRERPGRLSPPGRCTATRVHNFGDQARHAGHEAPPTACRPVRPHFCSGRRRGMPRLSRSRPRRPSGARRRGAAAAPSCGR